MKRNSILRALFIMLLFTISISVVFSNGDSEEQEGKMGSTPILEIWWAGISQRAAETVDHPLVQRAIKEIGIGWERPTVAWNGGTIYGEKLKLRLAAGDPPDVFRLPNFGFSMSELISSGLAADLTELLPQYAPTIYNLVPEEIWNIVRYESPNNDKIFYIPALRLAPTHAAFIRQDWLDRVGLDMPETEEEFFNVMRAFRDQDANGNGDPSDELPTTGRGPGRWWDHLFTPYGVAMFEGFPTWDYYNGKIEYSAVQPEMKRALAALHKAYEEGLIDPEVLVNKAKIWNAKFVNDQVGILFHMPIFNTSRTTNLYLNFPEAKTVWMPPFKVQGVDKKWSEGYVTSANTNEQIVINNSSEENVINALKLLEYLQQPETIDKNIWGVEGIHYTMENGNRVRKTDNMEEQKNIAQSFSQSLPVSTMSVYGTIDKFNILAMTDMNLQKRVQEAADKIYSSAKVISLPGTTLPQSIYDGYPDIATHQLYFSTMAKIMIGELDIDAFDDFVKEWYEKGGTEVTKRAQEAAKKLKL